MKKKKKGKLKARKMNHFKICLSSVTCTAVQCTLKYWKIYSDPQFCFIIMKFCHFRSFSYVYTFVREKENGTKGSYSLIK